MERDYRNHQKHSNNPHIARNTNQSIVRVGLTLRNPLYKRSDNNDRKK